MYKTSHITFIFLLLFSTITFSQNELSLLEIKAKKAYEYCSKKNLNTTYCILVNMNIHSGKNRLYVWDFTTNSILKTGLCSHGCCDSIWGEDETKLDPTFSNVHESHCSSLGKYKIGKRGYSNWGIHVNYKLHGLEKSNTNAYDRFIVLHSWEMIGDQESFPYGTAEGWGCPAVSNKLMKYLDNKFKKNTKAPLLWIYK